MRLLLYLAIAIVVMFGTLFALQRKLLFPSHHRNAPEDARLLPDEGEQWWMETDEGKIEAWYLPAEGASDEDPKPAVIFAHGNGELIDDWPGALGWYQRHGISVLIPEYRGYGRSAGSPSQEKLTRDFIEWHDRLVARPEVISDQIIFHGRSLGGGVLCALARHRKPSAMILQSTFTSIEAMAWKHYRAPSFLIKDTFRNIDVVKELDIPILIAHGRRDTLIPIEFARELHAAAPNSKLVEFDTGHNDQPPRDPAFWREVAEFLEDEE